jgi:hypothetical protein
MRKILFITAFFFMIIQVATTATSGEPRSGKNLPPAILSTLFFPDVVLKSLSLTPEELVVKATDSAWGLQSDIIFFYGPGDMHFYYEGQVKIHWKTVRGEQWEPGSLDLLAQVTHFDMIRRKDGIWRFLFRNAAAGVNVELSFERITRIIWFGKGDDNIEHEE